MTDAEAAALREVQDECDPRAERDAAIKQRDRALALLHRYVDGLPPQKPTSTDGDTQAFLAEMGPVCDWDGCTASVATDGDCCPAHACNCNPADQTGGGHHPTCPQFDPMHGAEPVQY